MQTRVTSVDNAPDDLHDQVPFEIDLIRKIPGPDRPDYWLGELHKPLRWLKDGNELCITHLVLAARLVGGVLTDTMQNTPVNIAYVVDASLLHDNSLDFSKCAYVAIGCADAVAAA